MTGSVAIACTFTLGVALAAGGCSASGPRTPASAPAPSPAGSEASPQRLYEAGRYADVVMAATAGGQADPQTLWLAAHSDLRLGQREEAATLLARVAETGDQAWKAVATLALAGLRGDAAAVETARTAAASFPNHPFVQYELGLAASRQGDFGSAVQALDRAIDASPAFAYAYYYAGLAYDRIGRNDLMAIRLEQFVRLAPHAPERPEVEAILRTVRGR